jgi:5-methylthioadenosine/S-adenosylhomocysteine deaminase
VATLIRNGIVLPMGRSGAREVLDPGSVLIEDGAIVSVGAVDALDADPRSARAEIVDATAHAVLPGLHNCHLHSGLLRCTTESLSLWDWLETYVDPTHRALTPEIAAAASEACYAEAILSGTTSVMDMWRFMDGSVRAADRLGLRATMVPYVADAEENNNLDLLEEMKFAALLQKVSTPP